MLNLPTLLVAGSLEATDISESLLTPAVSVFQSNVEDPKLPTNFELLIVSADGQLVEPPSQLKPGEQKRLTEGNSDQRYQPARTPLSLASKPQLPFSIETTVEPPILGDQSTYGNIDHQAEQKTNAAIDVLPAGLPSAESPLTIRQVQTIDTQLGTEMARQTAVLMRSEIVTFQEKTNHSIAVQIDPPELGRMNIEVEFAADHLSARIVVSEWASAELLSREKQVLVNSLADFGFTDTEVDISHGFLHQEESDSESTRPSHVLLVGEPGEEGEVYDEPVSTIVVGLNLVA